MSDRPKYQSRRPRRFRPTLTGVLGETLVIAGIGYIAFIAWQMVWTTYAYDAAAADRNQAISQEWQAEQITQKREAEPPSLTEPQQEGEIFARMWVPRFDQPPVPVAQGVNKQTVLDPIGMGHYPGTAMPGEIGNFAIAGHRTSFGRPLHNIAMLEQDDPIVIETPDAWYIYHYKRSQIVQPYDTWTISPDPLNPDQAATESRITLTACHPMYSRAERYVAWGELDRWQPKSEGLPAEIPHTLAEEYK